MYVIFAGPPGTGKTTVIAALVSSLLATTSHSGFIITQSNVGSKNIAEKLVKAGIEDWVLLVAAEFMAGWCERIVAYSSLLSRLLIAAAASPQARTPLSRHTEATYHHIRQLQEHPNMQIHSMHDINAIKPGHHPSVTPHPNAVPHRR